MTFALGLASVWFLEHFEFTENEEISNALIVTVTPQLTTPKFIETYRACGMGYIQGYATKKGIELSEGNLDCREPRKNDKRVIRRDNERIISKIDYQGKTYYEIYPFEKVNCITSPTIELGLELEQFLKDRKK
jgi:hypothetical protein